MILHLNKAKLFNNLLMFIIIATLTFTLSGSTGIALAQDRDPNSVTIPYVNRMTDGDGKPLDGKYDFFFAIYAKAEGGEALWSEIQTGVEVKSGDVRTALGATTAIPAAVVTGEVLWIEVGVRTPNEADFTMLTPRQAMTPDLSQTPNALSCPHSHFGDTFSGTSASYGLMVDNAGDGDGIRAYDYSTVYNYAPIYAVNSATTGSGSGLYALSYSGYAAYFDSVNYRGIYVTSAVGWYTGFFANRGGSTSPGVYIDGTLDVTGAKTGYIADIAINDGPEPLETGDVVVITGADTPVLGEIPVIRVRKATEADGTAIAGVVDQPYLIQPPRIPEIEKAVPAPAGPHALLSDGTAIQTGQYLSIVTLGSYKGVKVDATNHPIKVGDLLVAGPGGFAVASDNPSIGTVIGKALAELKEGVGLIPVMVTLR